MEIHDLNTKSLTDPAYVAFDDGTDTYKTEFNDVVANAAAAAVADADLTENTVAFTSGDAASPTAWTAVDVLTSGLSLKTLFNRISTMVKNVRYIWNLLGSSSFSNVASTLTGAIGNTALTTTAQTLSGAIAEHESDISTLNSNKIYWKTVYIASVTLSAGGFADMQNYKPAYPAANTAFLYALLKSYSNITVKGGFGLSANGSWLYGPPDATITGIYITYYFASNALLQEISQ